MVRRLLMLSALAVSGFAAAIGVSLDGGSTAAAAPAASPFRGAGIVVRVIDGDTLDVRLAGGARERVRVLGIDAPELGSRECHAAQASAAAQRLALGKGVRLAGDRTQAKRDRYRRLLAYVRLPNGADLGRELVAAGSAAVLVVGRPFLRVASYRSAESVARAERLGLWSCAGATTAGTPAPAPPAPAGDSSAGTTTAGTTTAGTTTGGTESATTTTETSTTTPVPACHMSFPDMCLPPITR